jgi:hypothetical protein
MKKQIRKNAKRTNALPLTSGLAQAGLVSLDSSFELPNDKNSWRRLPTPACAKPPNVICNRSHAGALRNNN